MPFMDEQETCIKDTSLVLGFVPTEEVRRQIESELGPLEPAADGERQRPGALLPVCRARRATSASSARSPRSSFCDTLQSHAPHRRRARSAPAC